jgi:hypothetical protein
MRRLEQPHATDHAGEREMASPKTITTMIFPSLSLFCLVVFVLSLYAPMILFSRSLLLGSLAVGVIAALVSIGSSILRRPNKTSLVVGIGVLVGFVLAAGLPVLLLFLYGPPSQD